MWGARQPGRNPIKNPTLPLPSLLLQGWEPHLYRLLSWGCQGSCCRHTGIAIPSLLPQRLHLPCSTDDMECLPDPLNPSQVVKKILDLECGWGSCCQINGEYKKNSKSAATNDVVRGGASYYAGMHTQTFSRGGGGGGGGNR